MNFLFSNEAVATIQALSDLAAARPMGAQEPAAAFRGVGMEIQNGIAYINLSGALLAEEGMFTRFLASIFGGTLHSDLQANLRAALAGPSVYGVLLTVDSPGGTVSGTEKTAQMVRDLAAEKPVVALVTNMAASAAYWAISGASKIFAEVNTASTGSIGVILSIRDSTERDIQNGIKTHLVVSRQSPKKAPDPNSPEGMAQLQNFVNSLAAVFISSVARNRGVSSDHVASRFGQGDILLARDAAAAGMIDQVGTREQAIAALRQLIAQQSRPGSAPIPANAVQSSVQELRAQLMATAHQEEQQRVKAILGMTAVHGRHELARWLALETSISVDTARQMMNGSLPIAFPGGRSGAQAPEADQSAADDMVTDRLRLYKGGAPPANCRGVDPLVAETVRLYQGSATAGADRTSAGAPDGSVEDTLRLWRGGK